LDLFFIWTCFFEVGCIDHFSVAEVEGDVVDSVLRVGVEQQIAGLDLTQRDQGASVIGVPDNYPPEGSDKICEVPVAWG